MQPKGKQEMLSKNSFITMVGHEEKKKKIKEAKKLNQKD